MRLRVIVGIDCGAYARCFTEAPAAMGNAMMLFVEKLLRGLQFGLLLGGGGGGLHFFGFGGQFVQAGLIGSDFSGELFRGRLGRFGLGGRGL